MEKQVKAGSKNNPYRVFDWSTAFDLCRELNRPVYVVTDEPDDNNIVYGKVFPSGRMEPGNQAAWQY